MTQSKTYRSFTAWSNQLFGNVGWRLEHAMFAPEFVTKVLDFVTSQQQLFEKTLEERKQLLAYLKQGIPEDLRHFLRGEFGLRTRLDERILELLTTTRYRDFICRFLEVDRFLIHYPPMVRFKIAQALDHLVPVHQDVAYNPHLSDFITAWVPLTDIDGESGGVIIYEGSHLNGIVPHKTGSTWHNEAETDLSPYVRRHMTMKAGDLLLFSPMLLHESAPHSSSRVRYSVDFRIFLRPSDTTKSYCDPFSGKLIRIN